MRGDLRADPRRRSATRRARRTRHRRPRRRRGRVQPRIHLPEGRDVPTTGQRPGSARDAAGQTRRRLRRNRLGRGPGAGGRSAARRDRHPRRIGGRPLPRQPVGAHPGRRDVRADARASPRQPQRLLRRHARPDAQTSRGRVPLRPRRDVRRARRRPHRPPRRHRRQPRRLQRQHDHGRRLPGQARRTAASRRSAHGDRPGTHPDRTPRRHPHRTATGNRRRAPGRRRGIPVRGGTRRRRSRRHRRVRPRRRPIAQGDSRSHSGTGGGVLRCSRRRDPPARPGHRGGADRGGLWADGYQHRRVRHPGQLADRRGEHPHRQPGPAGRGDVPDRAHRSCAATAPARQGIPHRTVAQPGVGSPGGGRGAAGGRDGRGVGDPGRGAAARAGHRRGQSGAVGSRRGATGRGTRRRRARRLHRPVSQRDHPPRRRHPAAAPTVAEPALRRRPPQPRGARDGPVLAAGAAAAGRTARRDRDRRPADPGPLRSGRRRRPRPRRRTGHRRDPREGGPRPAFPGRRSRRRRTGRHASRRAGTPAAAGYDAAARCLRGRLRRT